MSNYFTFFSNLVGILSAFFYFEVIFKRENTFWVSIKFYLESVYYCFFFQVISYQLILKIFSKNTPLSPELK